MAVLDGLPGVEVTVVVDGEDLHEYQDADMEDDESTVTKYIEAVDGAYFAVKIKVTKDAAFKGFYLTFQVLVDGKHIRKPLVRTAQLKKTFRTEVVDCVKVKAGYVQKLRFSALETVNEHGLGLPEDLKRVKKIGKIEVVVSHANRDKPILKKYHEPNNSDGIISEKAVKGLAITHSYSLGPQIRKSDNHNHWRTKPVPGVKISAGSFVFHYRSNASLKQLMIIPRTPSPIPLEDRAEEELSREEMTELLRRYKANASSTARIKKEHKREHEDDNDNNSRGGKRTRSSTSADPAYLELNDDDDTFTEVAVAPKEKTIISLDD